MDGTGLEQITFSDTFDGFPMFSPDGTKLIFASNRNAAKEGDTNLFIADWVASPHNRDGPPSTACPTVVQRTTRVQRFELPRRRRGTGSVVRGRAWKKGPSGNPPASCQAERRVAIFIGWSSWRRASPA